MYIGLHAKHPLFMSNFTETKFSRWIFENYSNIKFHDNPSMGIDVFLTDGGADRHEDSKV